MPAVRDAEHISHDVIWAAAARIFAGFVAVSPPLRRTQEWQDRKAVAEHAPIRAFAVVGIRAAADRGFLPGAAIGSAVRRHAGVAGMEGPGIAGHAASEKSWVKTDEGGRWAALASCWA